MEVPTDDQLILKWLESQPVSSQKFLTEQRLTELLDQAAQPRHASGNACIKLCYFIEQCGKSKSQEVKEVAYSSDTCLLLFDFYIEWNEKNQNRSMRQILELISSLIIKNTDEGISKTIKLAILRRNLSIILHRGAQPLVKPAFKSLESFLAKGTISTSELIHGYHVEEESNLDKIISSTEHNGPLWDSLLETSFEWMTLPDISPAAGKFLVTVFRELRARRESESSEVNNATSWQRWIRRGLEKDPESLENLKNYLFPPLFKIDRSGSLLLLEELNGLKPSSGIIYGRIDSNALLHLSAMEAGKKAGLVEDPDSPAFRKTPKKKSTSIVLREETIAPLLVHPLNTVRSMALSVIVHSSSSIRPFTTPTMQMLRLNLSAMYSDTDAKFRNDVLSNTKHMIERLRGATALLTRETNIVSRQTLAGNRQEQGQAMMQLQIQHKEFLEWFLDFLLDELIPTASYQRHITALKALHLLLQSGILKEEVGAPVRKLADNDTIWPFSITFFEVGSIRLLLDLLLDPFEDVRVIATEVLKLAPPDVFFFDETSRHELDIQSLSEDKDTTSSHPKFSEITLVEPNSLQVHSKNILKEFLISALNVSMRTGRADFADGVAHTYELLYKFLPSSEQEWVMMENLILDLEENLTLAETDLSKAIHKAPVHGTFAALRLIWESIDQKQYELEDAQVQVVAFLRRIFLACTRVWSAVRDILCNDSPEGHLPQDLDEADTIDTKDVLSYSFRAIHESSNLMRTLAGQIKPKRRGGFSFIPAELFTDIGNLTFEQLSSLRHRGAFSTVSLTFARVCQLSSYIPLGSSPDGSMLLNQYYHGALDCISEQASTTRRSAGIPALIAGVLSANAPTPSFQAVMTELKSLAKKPVTLSDIDETNLPQVHAMNCLRDVFRSSTLGKRAEPYIADALQIASDSLNSDIWAIRNCGLLLLRSLIDCLFGTSESKLITEAGWDGKSIKLSYDKYPALPELLFELLDSETGNADKASEPQIGAVESVFPALDIIRRAGPPDVNREQIYGRVCKHLGSKVWHIRELAARTVCTLLLHDKWLTAVEELFSQCHESANKTHGTLLAVKFFVERQRILNPNSLINSLPKLISILPNSNNFVALERASSHIRGAKIELENTLGSVILSMTEDRPESLQSVIDALFNSDGISELKEKFDATFPDALLHLALLRRAIYTTAVSRDPVSLWNILKLVATKSADLILAAMELLDEAWPASEETLLPLSDAYIQVIDHSGSPDVRAVATFKLCELLDRCFDIQLDAHKGVLYEVETLPEMLLDETQSPQLINAEIRLTGWRYLQELLPRNEPEDIELALPYRMKAWGVMLSSAGDANNDFDTRLAAVSALRSFFAYAKLEPIPTQEFILPSFFALYDTLNDDDDEIRDIGAETISAILKRPFVPLAAQKAFLDWLLDSYPGSPGLAINVVLRMTGSNSAQKSSSQFISGKDQKSSSQFISGKDQLQASIQQDNSLFIEEEQNLFIDEVRESKQWGKVFSKLSAVVLLSEDHLLNGAMPFSSLKSWTLFSLIELNSLARMNKDGPLGWTSKPAAFTTCTRIISCANAVLEFIERTPEQSDELVDRIKIEIERVRGIEGFHPTLLALAKGLA